MNDEHEVSPAVTGQARRRRSGDRGSAGPGDPSGAAGGFPGSAGIAVADAIAAYRPAIADAKVRALVGGFARSVVAELNVDSGQRARVWLSDLASLAQWAIRVGYPINRHTLLRRDVVAEYTADKSLQQSPKSRGTIRSRLNLVCQLIGSGAGSDAPLPTIGRGQPLQPYSATEIKLLRSWARHQRSERRIVNTTVLLAFGFGAGLTAIELCGIRAADVIIDDGGVVLTITQGPRGRTVPMLAEWEAPVVDIARAAIRAEQFIFLPTRRSVYYSSLLWNFLHRNTDYPVDFAASRMRATWLTHHLASGTPLKTLLEMAGVISPEVLESLLRFVPRLDDATSRYLMRHANPELLRSRRLP